MLAKMGLTYAIARTRAAIRAHGARVCALALLGSALGAFGLATAGATSPPPPSVNGVYATSVTQTSALLIGYVNPRALPTTYTFQYGPNTAYGSQTPAASAGSGSSEVRLSQSIAGLSPGATYHFRIIATSSAGTATGPDHTFTTASIPLSFQLTGTPDPVTYDNPFTLSGTLSGTGAAGRAVALQTNPFPYLAGFKTIGDAVLTSATGGFSFPALTLLENTQVRVITTTAPLATSGVFLERVGVRVTFHARRLRRPGRRLVYRLYGTVTPAEPGASVGFQWLRPGGHSINLGGTLLKPSAGGASHFSATVHIRHRGLYQALVLIHDGAHVSAYSAPVSFP
jgi:hypothetical protein